MRRIVIVASVVVIGLIVSKQEAISAVFEWSPWRTYRSDIRVMSEFDVAIPSGHVRRLTPQETERTLEEKTGCDDSPDDMRAGPVRDGLVRVKFRGRSIELPFDKGDGWRSLVTCAAFGDRVIVSVSSYFGVMPLPLPTNARAVLFGFAVSDGLSLQWVHQYVIHETLQTLPLPSGTLLVVGLPQLHLLDGRTGADVWAPLDVGDQPVSARLDGTDHAFIRLPQVIRRLDLLRGGWEWETPLHSDADEVVGQYILSVKRTEVGPPFRDANGGSAGRMPDVVRVEIVVRDLSSEKVLKTIWVTTAPAGFYEVDVHLAVLDNDDVRVRVTGWNGWV